MGRFKLLLGVVLTAQLLLATAPAPSPASQCTSGGIYAGGCVTSSNNGDSVGLAATSGSSTGGSGATHHRTGGAVDEAPNGDTNSLSICVVKDDTCIYIDNQDPATTRGAAAVAPTVVTLADVATFRPVAPAGSMEPGGWAVLGLDANFIAIAPTQTIAGTLLGRPASVRFTASAYRWSYGDGASARLLTPGASWTALHLPEFSHTATSHVFTSAGNFTVQLITEYSAAYQVSGSPDWLPVDGTLGIPAAPITVHVGDASTVLVGSDCTADPSGPGC